MERRTTLTLAAVGLLLVAAGMGVPAAVGLGSDALDADSNDMTETEFSWGTVTHERDEAGGETHVEVVIETDSGISVSTMTSADPIDVDDANAETFEWGAVIHETDSDTGTTAVEVIVHVDDGEDVSIDVMANSGEVIHSETTTVSQSSGSSTVSQSANSSTTVSQSSNVSVGDSGPFDDWTDG